MTTYYSIYYLNTQNYWKVIILTQTCEKHRHCQIDKNGILSIKIMIEFSF